MARADELIREAWFAFHNIGPGSTDNERYVTRAKRVAGRIIRQYPRSIEAAQAREILWNLGDRKRPAKIPQVHVHDEQPRHRPHEPRRTPPKTAPMPRAVRARPVTDPTSWAAIWQRITALPKPQRNSLGVMLFIAFILFATVPFLLFVFVIYALRPSRVKQHLVAVLDSLDSLG